MTGRIEVLSYQPVRRIRRSRCRFQSRPCEEYRGRRAADQVPFGSLVSSNQTSRRRPAQRPLDVAGLRRNVMIGCTFCSGTTRRIGMDLRMTARVVRALLPVVSDRARASVEPATEKSL